MRPIDHLFAVGCLFGVNVTFQHLACQRGGLGALVCVWCALMVVWVALAMAALRGSTVEGAADGT